MSDDGRPGELATRSDDGRTNRTEGSLAQPGQLSPERVEALVAMLGRAVTLLETLPRLEASVAEQAARLQGMSERLERLEGAAAGMAVETAAAVADLKREVSFVGTQAIPGTMAAVMGDLAALRDDVRSLTGPSAPEPQPAAPDEPDIPTIEAPPDAPAPEVEAAFEEFVWMPEEEPAPHPRDEWPPAPHDTGFDERLARLKAQKAQDRERWEEEHQDKRRRGFLARLFGR